MPAPDYRFFHPDGPAAKSVPRTEHEQKRLDGTRFVFEDSVIPIEAAGQIVQWSQDYRVSDSLRLRAAEGHTPGSSVLWLDAGQQAVFVGDLTHSPIQLRRPADACAFDVDPIAAAVTRKRVLTEAAHTEPSSFPRTTPATALRPSARTTIDSTSTNGWSWICSEADRVSSGARTTTANRPSRPPAKSEDQRKLLQHNKTERMTTMVYIRTHETKQRGPGPQSITRTHPVTWISVGDRSRVAQCGVLLTDPHVEYQGIGDAEYDRGQPCRVNQRERRDLRTDVAARLSIQADA